MSCRVIANHFVQRGRDLSDFIERQAIAALAVTLGPRAFSEQWGLSIGADRATGAITFTIEGPGFVRQYAFIGPPNQVGQFIENKLREALQG